MKRTKRALFFAFCLLSLSTQADQVVMPPFFGNTALNQPFALNALGVPSMRYQQVFANDRFQEVAPDGMLITAIAFGSSNVFTSRQPLFQINLSTISREPDALSTVFAENVGSDDRNVFGPGSITWQTFDRSFNLVVSFHRSFAYYPAQGNLLLDIRNFQQEQPCSPFAPDCTRPLYGETTIGDPVSRVFAPAVDALTGTADTAGLAAVFTFTPIPEPSSVALFLFGLSILGIVGWRFKRVQS